jgi:hypothetical protein
MLVISLFFGILWYFESDMVGGMLAVDSIEQTTSGANQAEILIQPVVSNLLLADLEDSNNLVEGKIQHLQGEKIQQTYQVQNEQGVFTLESSGGTIIFPTVPGSDPSWNLGLTTKIPLELTVKLVIGKSTIEAQNLQLSGLSTSVVIGETLVYLPERGVLNAKIEGVIGSLTIYVPDSMKVSINADVGLLNVQLPEDFISREDTFYSPGYVGAENRVDLEVSQVLGKVEIVEK